MRATVSGGFRLYNQFCVFIYAQLQVIFPARFLGNVADWDSYMTLDLSDDNLPYKTVDEFLLDRDFSDLIDRSKISTPRRFVSQTISFYRCFIRSPLTNELATSPLARGLSSFDEAVIRDGAEAHYSDSIQLLCGYLSSKNGSRPISSQLLSASIAPWLPNFVRIKLSPTRNGYTLSPAIMNCSVGWSYSVFSASVVRR